MGLFHAQAAYALTGPGFDTNLVKEIAIERTMDALKQLISVTACNVSDSALEHVKSYFRSNAYIVVTTLRTKDKLRLRIPQYILDLEGLHCPGNSRYRTVQFLFGDVSPEDVTVQDNGATMTAVVPIRQTFIGMGRVSRFDYADVCLKKAVLIFYYESGMLKWKIARIEADWTKPLHPAMPLTPRKLG
jgi:hypothetical protein